MHPAGAVCQRRAVDLNDAAVWLWRVYLYVKSIQWPPRWSTAKTLSTLRLLTHSVRLECERQYFVCIHRSRARASSSRLAFCIAGGSSPISASRSAGASAAPAALTAATNSSSGAATWGG